MEEKNYPYLFFVAELTHYRKGSITVRFDFENSLIIWEESARWTRNFTRSFSLQQKQSLLSAIRDCELETWERYYPDELHFETPGVYQSIWHIEAERRDGTLLASWGRDCYPRPYGQLVDCISELARQRFYVNE